MIFLLEREKTNFDEKKCSLYKYYAYLCIRNTSLRKRIYVLVKVELIKMFVFVKV